MPHKDDSSLSLYETYEFKGYSMSVGGDLINLSTILVTEDEEFYAIFEKIDDVRKIVHEDWFEQDGKEVTITESYSGYTATGIILKPKRILTGKITIPRKFNGKDVIALSGFNTPAERETSLHTITHVFMEKQSDMDSKAPLCKINGDAFETVKTLKYFDFEGASVK
jgi:hypothetical protein